MGATLFGGGHSAEGMTKQAAPAGAHLHRWKVLSGVRGRAMTPARRYLGYNQLTEVPTELGGLTALTLLCVPNGPRNAPGARILPAQS